MLHCFLSEGELLHNDYVANGLEVISDMVLSATSTHDIEQAARKNHVVERGWQLN
jgi:hypothetical protein